jgi:hypothetical protein
MKLINVATEILSTDRMSESDYNHAETLTQKCWKTLRFSWPHEAEGSPKVHRNQPTPTIRGG